MAAHNTPGVEDPLQIAAKCGDANRLDYALVLLYIPWPGCVLEVEVG